MIITAVIAEFNPFHDGHRYLISQARELTHADLVVIVMSGDFVQRGAPAFIDKYTRAEMALSSGADLILELPVYGSLSSAETFSGSAVAILNALGCVDYLCFGTECDRPDKLKTAAELFYSEPEEYKAALKEKLTEGFNFPAARAFAMTSFLKDEDMKEILEGPNNILAIEYLRALIMTGSQIKAVPVKRSGGDYHALDLNGPMPSAGAIRHFLSQNENTDKIPGISGDAHEILKNYLSEYRPVTSDDFSLLLGEKLLSNSDDLTDVPDISPDLSCRIRHLEDRLISVEAFADLLVTRNMTRARMTRSLFRIILGHSTETADEWKERGYGGYARVLGFTSNGSQFFKSVRTSDIALICSARDAGKLDDLSHRLFEADLYAQSLYRLVLMNKSSHYIKKPLSRSMILPK